MCIDGCEINISKGGISNRVFGRINHFRASRDRKFEDWGKRRKVEMLNMFFRNMKEMGI